MSGDVNFGGATSLTAFSASVSGIWSNNIALPVGRVMADGTKRAMDHVVQIAREMWSMPPDHGGAVVRTVLQDASLTADWRAELDEMRGP